jgi:hypothetical protein
VNFHIDRLRRGQDVSPVDVISTPLHGGGFDRFHLLAQSSGHFLLHRQKVSESPGNARRRVDQQADVALITKSGMVPILGGWVQPTRRKALSLGGLHPPYKGDRGHPRMSLTYRRNIQ